MVGRGHGIRQHKIPGFRVKPGMTDKGITEREKETQISPRPSLSKEGKR